MSGRCASRVSDAWRFYSGVGSLHKLGESSSFCRHSGLRKPHRMNRGSQHFLNGPMQLAQQRLRKSLKAVRKLRRSVLLGVSCTLATSLGYSRIGGLQLSCELVDRNTGR